LCKLFGISRQGYYQKLKKYQLDQQLQQLVIHEVKKVRKRHKRMGGRKVHEKILPNLEKSGIKCGRDKFFDILRADNMLVKYKRRYVVTTQSKHLFYKYPNLIQHMLIYQSEQVFVSDITYIRTKKGFMYLFLITDAYSKQIMGWELADNMKTINAVRALKMAISNRKYPQRKLIHHSDRGFQYCNPSYIEVLEKNNIEISMTTKYDPYENAVAERVNGILKSEYGIGEGFLGYKDAKREIKFAIWLYNTDRPHLSCHGMVPVEAHEKENYKLKKWSKKILLGACPQKKTKNYL
jgi:transposase InsO family protein